MSEMNPQSMSPHDNQCRCIESNYLSLLFQDPKLLDVSVSLDAADFTAPLYAKIFKALKSVAASGENITKPHVLAIAGLDTDVETLQELCKQFTLTDYNSPAEAVIALSREIKTASENAKAKSRLFDMVGPDLNIEKMADVVREREIREMQMRNESSIDSLRTKAIKRVDSNFKAVSPARVQDNDLFTAAFGGIVRKQLTILAGRSKHGKTQVSLASAIRLAKEGRRVLFYSTELSTEVVEDMIFSNISNVPVENFSRTLSEENAEIAKEAMFIKHAEVINNLEVHFRLAPELHDVQADIKRLTVQKGNKFDVIVFDFIQNIAPPDERCSEIAVIKKSMRAFREIAEENNAAVILLCQVSRKGLQGEWSEIPEDDVLGGSDYIFQFANDVIVLRKQLVRPAYDVERKQFKVGAHVIKARFGEEQSHCVMVQPTVCRAKLIPELRNNLA